MSRIWRLVSILCGILLPLSIAFLQVNGVAENIVTRTLTLSAAVFASSGLLTSGLYVCNKARFQSKKLGKKWKQASENHRSSESVEFWALLALPLSSLIWSAICCICTVLAVASDLGTYNVLVRASHGEHMWQF
ncbi:hypothetical protein CPC08DRAFT_719311 [Agrocybe pediades]|nr:hypothetical protein CPC08DRAFT_719311 [Agrocybe pediades]